MQNQMGQKRCKFQRRMHADENAGERDTFDVDNFYSVEEATVLAIE